MIEEWRDIAGYEGRYQVSNLGRVKALARRARYEHWITGQEHFRQTKERIVSQQRQNAGYMLVHLMVEWEREALLVHRLVAQAFVPPVAGAHEVNHIDGNKANNAACNLAWVTRTENHLHAVDTGLNKQAIAVVCPATGTRYPSMAQAGRAVGQNWRHIKTHFIVEAPRDAG